MFVCSFHEHIRVVVFITLHVFFVFCVVMYAFVHVILFDDICLFVCRSGLVPLDADNLCLIIQL